MRDDLPRGTVTFVFTDVEGSTALLAELGAERFAEALAEHRELVRAALLEHGGAEVDTQGDAFFCAFGYAAAAVGFAEDVQARSAATRIQVRIGIHTGEALVSGDHYVGMDVHRAARIGAAGHGGQVVISSATAGLLDAESFELRDLGDHRLKDLSAPVRLYQLGAAELGPLKTLFRTNLPVPATAFLGRGAELAELTRRLSERSLRLLTLTGPGGTGKTRLALQLAGELADGFPDGVFWAPLASLRDPALVQSTVADVLGVREEPGRSVGAAIVDTLRARRVLFLLDNCEHVLGAVVEVVAPVLASCPDVLLVATSREPLEVSGEHVYAVQPLASTDASALFDARARAAGAPASALEGGDGDVIGALCARLDNLPLAVELAAARAAALTPAALLDRLESRLDVLRGPRDADERQRTLHATIAWSYDLLEEGEQCVFRRLAVFAGGATLEAAETVCDAELDDLLSLVAKSLVRYTATEGGDARYWMLETIREFAVDRLGESGEHETYRDRHCSWFAQVAVGARERLVGPGSSEVLARLERDRENLRSAFARALEREGMRDGEAAVRAGSVVPLAVVLCRLHTLHGRYGEAEAVARHGLDGERGALDAAALLQGLGVVLSRQGRVDEGVDALREAERILDSTNVRGSAWWTAWIDVRLEQAHRFYYEGDLDELARVIAESRSVVEEHGSPVQRLEFLHVLAQDAYRRERYVPSEETETLVREIYLRSLELEDVYAEFTLGFCLLWRGKLDEAETHMLRGLESARARGDALIEARCLVYALLARRRRGDVEGARQLLAELDALEDLQRYSGLVHASAAWIALRDGDLARAAELGERALADWAADPGRGGPAVFQWGARFPLMAVALADGDAAGALAHANSLLDPRQQPLPAELGEIVRTAVHESDAGALRSALELARLDGYV